MTNHYYLFALMIQILWKMPKTTSQERPLIVCSSALFFSERLLNTVTKRMTKRVQLWNHATQGLKGGKPSQVIIFILVIALESWCERLYCHILEDAPYVSITVIMSNNYLEHILAKFPREKDTRSSKRCSLGLLFCFKNWNIYKKISHIHTHSLSWLKYFF